MATNFINVKCSGALFSSLQHELLHNKIQEGFLLGHAEKFTSHIISDSQIDNENIHISINVSGYLPCLSMGSFYNGCGRVNIQYLKNFLGENFENVIGWYRSKKNPESLFLREMRVHQQLCEELGHIDKHFVLALFSRIQPAVAGTMDVHYKFHIMNSSLEFDGVSLSIVNMNDTSSSQFIRGDSSSSSLYDSKSLQIVLEGLKNVEPGVKEAEQLHNGLMNHLRSLLPKYGSIQEQHSKALQRVCKLREICYSSGIKPIFYLNESKGADDCVMGQESSSPKFKTRQVESLEKIPCDMERNGSCEDNDLFDFVEKEMEKQQESGNVKKKTPKIKKLHDANALSKFENSNIKGKPKVQKKILDPDLSRFRSMSGRGRGGGSSVGSSSPSRKNLSKDNSIRQNSVSRKTRTVRGGKVDGTTNNNLRHQSPSNSPNRPKEKQNLNDKKVSSDSQEY